MTSGGSMLALTFHEHGPSSVLRMEEVDIPSVGFQDALVRVKATSINHLDITVRDGSAGVRVKFPHIGGCDAVGSVVRVGNGVRHLKEGDRVVLNPGYSCGVCAACKRGEESFCPDFGIFGEHRQGAFAEFISVPARNLISVPESFPLVKAAAAPLVYLTAWHALVRRGAISFGDRLLVTGGSGGVSTAAIQIAKLFDATVVTTTRSEEKVDALRRLGAEEVILAKEEGWAKKYLSENGSSGFDIVLDSVGSAVWGDCMRALAKGGRLVNYGRTSGGAVTADLSHIFWKQLQIVGSTMASQSEFETVMKLVYSRRLDPVVDQVFPLRDGGRAQDYVMSAKQVGKVVLLVGES